MSITERKQREKEELRQLILDGATKVLQRDGYDNLSIRKVAKEIQYSPGTIYVYYRDKDELLLALHREIMACKTEQYLPLMQIEDPIERILEMGRIYIQIALDDPDAFHLMFVLNAPIIALACQDEEWDMGQTGFGFLVGFIQEAIDKGIFRSDIDANGLALMLWSSVHGLSMLHLSKRLDAFQDYTQAEPHNAFFTQTRLLLESLKR